MTKVLLTDLVIGESPRWHDGRLWFCHWGPDEVIAIDTDGKSEVMLTAPAHSIDWLPDGRLLIVSKQGGLLRQEPSGELVPHLDTDQGFNEIVVDGRGNIYLNSVGFDFMGFLKGEAEFGTGTISLVTPDGTVTEVADDIHFANGMVVTPDNRTLVISESFARRLTAFDITDDGSLGNRRIWADNVAPDGITMDTEGAIWTSVTDHDVSRVKEGGEVLETIELDRMSFACMLGEDTLYVMAAQWNPDNPFGGPRTGQVLAFPAPAPGVGWPGQAKSPSNSTR
jgi:sugar lactone lactonase YvrE